MKPLSEISVKTKDAASQPSGPSCPFVRGKVRVEVNGVALADLEEPTKCGVQVNNGVFEVMGCILPIKHDVKCIQKIHAKFVHEGRASFVFKNQVCVCVCWFFCVCV
eukprot:GHVR01058010.1.p1 GENE.GHVR01058010.1~~GHVR01058010.1.p1  ORF type:complete len:107 (+),score=28.65 GHVR01058010.1:63-383(+)